MTSLVRLSLILVLGLGVHSTARGAEKKRGKAKAVAKAAPAPTFATLSDRVALADTRLYRDFPDLSLDASGTAWVAYVEHDGSQDVLKLARRTGQGLEEVAAVSTPGVIHQPAVTTTGEHVWCFWGQLDERNVITLRARRWAKGGLEAEQTLAASAGSDTFADAGTDAAGRVWIAWQSLRRGQADIYVRHLDPKSGRWSPELRVSRPEAGHWEPRLAFAGGDAWIVFDSSRGGEFNLYLARVSAKGEGREFRLTDSPDYEARASITPAKDGKGFWIAGERGRRRWGLDIRGHVPDDSLNGRKRLLLGRFDLASEKFSEIAVPADGQPAPRPAGAVNLPEVATDLAGNPWIAYRYYTVNRWAIALLRHDLKTGGWSKPVEIPDSTLGQDRHATLQRDGAGRLHLCWPSDLRENKVCGIPGVYLARVEPEFEPLPKSPLKISFLDEPEEYLNAPTPERPREERHSWKIGGKTYSLYFGDLHRHTDFSNCRTGQDGCIVEHFRYAIDMAALDFLGTSDHTDIAKRYDPYEWWQTQRLVDVFYVPGRFNSLYAYEREQRHPWGHRNIVFAQRGGPIIYINRQLHRNSIWQERFPVVPGTGEITPMELWKLLRDYGRPVAAISHTGATGMGTDWDRYERIDNEIENIVEMFQGARVSYEALGAPQPTVGLRKGEPYTPSAKAKDDFVKPPNPIPDFGAQYNSGVYQRALANGHKLGAFASSDHGSQHTSFGGVYVENFTREGIIAGFKARRTVAATDKIFIELGCDGNAMGSACAVSGQPVLQIAVHGTAPLTRVTIVRNETNHHVFEPGGKSLTATYTDARPLPGENRYYLRIEQSDGNMAWSSPLWVTVGK